MRDRVDLPAPLTPSRAIFSPRLTVKLIPEKTCQLAVVFAQVRDREHLLAAALGLGEAEIDLSCLFPFGDQVEFFQLLDAALHFGGLAGLGAETVDIGLDALDLGFLQLALLLQGRGLLFLFLQVMGIIPLVNGDLAPVEFGDLADHLVQEHVVVGNGQQRAAVISQVVFQPLHALGVQVVGRFVQEHDLRLGEQDDGQEYAHLPAAGKIAAVLFARRRHGNPAL